MPQKMGLMGRKIGMTQYFWEDGSAIGCTALSVGPCVVTALLTEENNGYSAVQLGFEEKPARNTNRPEAGAAKKAGLEAAPRTKREIRLPAEALANFEVGKVLKASDVFKAGDVVDITGNSQGKGFQGVMKRHNFSGFHHSHGVHEFYRHGGSLGCRLTPGRVFKGKKMPGQMGDARVTAANVVIMDVLDDKGVILVKGPVPGPKNGLVTLKGSSKDVVRTVVRGPVQEIESKNPMKASKKGAPSKKK